MRVGILALITDSAAPAEAVGRLHAAAGPDAAVVAVVPRAANLPPELVAACTALVVGDAAAAADLLGRAVRGDVRPTLAAVHLPLAADDDAVFAAADALAAEQRGMPLVLANGVVRGDVTADVPAMGVTAFVVTDNDAAFARNLADDLAAAAWQHRAAGGPAGFVGREYRHRRRPLYPFEPAAEWQPATG